MFSSISFHILLKNVEVLSGLFNIFVSPGVCVCGTGGGICVFFCVCVVCGMFVFVVCVRCVCLVCVYGVVCIWCVSVWGREDREVGSSDSALFLLPFSAPFRC